MSLINRIEPLQCTKCPFLNCYERGTCYICKCFLDETLNLDEHCDNKTAHLDCPLRDGRIIVVKVKNGHLLIGEKYQ